MKTVVLKDSESERVEISFLLYELLGHDRNYSFVGDSDTLREIVNKTLQNMSEIGAYTNQEVSYSSRVVVAQTNYWLHFHEPYDVFSGGINYIMENEEMLNENDINDLIDNVQHYYLVNQKKYKGKLYLAIFDKELKGIRGVFGYATESDVYILYWGYEKLTFGEIDY